MIDSIVQLTIVIDFILSVLVSASSSKTNCGFLVLQRCSTSKELLDDKLSLHADILFLVEVRYRAVERR